MICSAPRRLAANHTAKANRPVADDGHRLPGSDLGDYGRVLAGTHHVGEGQQRGQQRVVLRHRKRNECAVGLGNAKRLGLGPADLASTEEATVDAGRLEALATEGAHPIGEGEGHDDELPSVQVANV